MFRDHWRAADDFNPLAASPLHHPKMSG